MAHDSSMMLGYSWPFHRRNKGLERHDRFLTWCETIL